MARGFSTRSRARMRWFTVATLCSGVVLVFAAGCVQKQPPEKVAATGDPLADLPVVFGREAQLIQRQSRGIGTLFNESLFEQRKRAAEKVKAEYQVQIDKLQDEIAERYTYIEAVEALKSNIEADCSRFPPYLELISQVSTPTLSGEDLWKVAAVWVVLETRAAQYRQYVDDVCTGQMAQKYLSISDSVQKAAESRIRPRLTGMYSDFSRISAGYAKATDVSKLKQDMTALNKTLETLGWVGSEYFDMHYALRRRTMAERTDVGEPTDKSGQVFIKMFDETVSEIKTLVHNVELHIGVCEVLNNCEEKFARLMEDGLQARDVKLIEGLKKRLADKEPQAPSEDSANVLKQGRDGMDRLVEQEVEKMRRTRDQLEALCKRQPDFARPENYLSQLREGQEELRTTKAIFYALNLFDDAEKADAAKQLAETREKSFDKLRQMYNAQQEMQAYARELRQLPRYGARTSAQRKRADEMRKKLQEYRIKFSRFVSDPDLADYAEPCLNMIDELIPQIGE